MVFTRDEDLRFLGHQLDVGISQRLGDDWSVDVGLAQNQFRAAYEGGFPYHYTEAYLGASRGAVSAYVFLSPNYLEAGYWTVYGQLDGSLAPATNWRISGHVGSLSFLDTPEDVELRHYTYYDWRLSVAREFGNVEVHAALSSGGPGKQYYAGARHSRTALTAGASVNF